MISQREKYYIIIGGLLLAFIYFFGVTFFHIPKENERLADVILGVLLGSCIKDAYNYLFGSTSGSQAKDQSNSEEKSKLIDALANSQPSVSEQLIKKTSDENLNERPLQ